MVWAGLTIIIIIINRNIGPNYFPFLKWIFFWYIIFCPEIRFRSKKIVEKRKRKKECDEVGISKHLKICVGGGHSVTYLIINHLSSGQKSLHFQFACQLGLEKFGHPQQTSLPSSMKLLNYHFSFIKIPSSPSLNFILSFIKHSCKQVVK
jgi:hypothetical protein